MGKSYHRAIGHCLPQWLSPLTVLPTTRRPVLTPARKAGTRFAYPRGIEGGVNLGGWLHAEMVFLPADGHPSIRGPNIEQLHQLRPIRITAKPRYRLLGARA